MRRTLNLYFEDIKTAIRKIEKFTQNLDFNAFRDDEKTIDAVVRNLEIIGEATKNIPPEVKNKFPSIPWKRVIGMRNKVIHEYFGVDVEILWKTITEEIPILKKELSKIKRDMNHLC